jgi:hypothetical protein
MRTEQGSDRLERAARNQALFRELNERLQGVADAFDGTRTVFVCECADPGCTEQVEVPTAEYEAIRSDGNSFLVARGHVFPDVERVERETPNYTVVAKIGEGGRIAEAADPRAA